MSNSPPYQGGESQDFEIISRVLGGDTNAFEVLVHRYSRLVAGIVGKHIPRGRVDEVAQDAFVEGFRSLSSFSQTGPFGHWMAKIAARCCHDFWRKHHRKKEVLAGDLSQGAQDWMDNLMAVQSDETFERESAAAEAIEILDHALARLSAKDRMVVTLVHLEGLPVKEAAVLLDWSVTAVKVRAHRSRKKLRRIILDLQDGAPETEEVMHEKA